MKNFIKPLTIVLFAAVVLTSCNKDDKKDATTPPVTIESKITVNDTTYNLQTTGLLEDYGTDDGSDPDWQYQGTNFDLWFMTEGVTPVYDSDGALDSAYGNGLVFYFESFSADSKRLADGTYKYQADSPYPTGTFDWSFYINPSATMFKEIEDGTLVVSSSGSTYTITFDLTDENGIKITGTFHGTLNIADLK